MKKSGFISKRIKGLLLVSLLVLGFSGAACAKDKAKTEDKAASKDAVVKELRVIQAQEIRLLVLQQLFNQEAAVLKQKHSAFCQANDLNEEKFKKGLYQFDEATGKFIEKPAAAGASATPAKK